MKKVKWLIVLLLITCVCSTEDNLSEKVEEVENSVLETITTGEEYVPPKTHEEDTDTGSEEIIENDHKIKLMETHEEASNEQSVEPAQQESVRRSGNLVSAPVDPRVNSEAWDSLRSKYAPSEKPRVTGDPHIITDARLDLIREDLMYWFWDQGGSDDNGDFEKNIQSSTPTVHKNLNFQLPFFGFRFNYTRVSINGYLEFSDPPPTFPSYPLVFPNKDWPKQNDPSFMGIFYSKCRIGSIRHDDIDQRKAGVYFRMERDLVERKDVFGVEMRERLKWDIRKGVIGAETFDPKHAIIVTWKNVTFSGGIVQAMMTTNTFQLVLATDEVITYAIFNYKDIQWTSHTEANGDTLKGEGGTPAFVGFNAGNGTRSYEYKPYSQGSVIRDLTSKGWGNNKAGRHIFRLDENIMLGSCNKDIDDANLPLFIAPESGNMLGGTIVNITGPCFEPKDKIRCKFDVEVDEVQGIVIDKNRAICIQPRLFVEGYVNLEIAIGNEKYKWKGKYFVEPPASASQKIFFEGNSVYEKYPEKIRMTWVKHNLTTNENAMVDISVWGYRERTIRPEFVYIDSIAQIANQGEYDIAPGNYRTRDNRIFSDIKFGFLQINITSHDTNNPIEPVIWSRPIPLAWYFAAQWEREYGKKWPQALCDNWIKNDRYLKNFAHELPQCPCSIEHALNDKGRFIPDFNCDKDTNPTCQYNKGAVHCVRSGAPTLEGSEQQCCYDKNGYLMLTYDQQWGSTPFRSHNLGYLPWNEANKVPTLSQWFHDVIPKYMCCRWQDNKSTGETGEQSVGCETLRFERRPTQDCVAYQPPAVAGVFGDPHIITFDDVEYTFNGLGEFTLVKTENKNIRLDVQGRFEQMPINENGEVRATQLTAITARGNSSVVIEVRKRPIDASWRYRLDVLADGKRIYFDRPSLKFQHFPGVLVYTPTYILNQSEVVIMFDSGAGVEVIENSGYLSARVYLPWKFINQTRGLFGNWSFDMMDDFVDPKGNRLSMNPDDMDSIHRDFGMKWMLEDRDVAPLGKSLFHREFGRTSSTYNNKEFVPIFEKDADKLLNLLNRTNIQELANNLCQAYYQCKYDYAMTLNRDLAHFSFNYHSSIKNIKEINKKLVISCGVLETPRFGRKSNFLFVPGTKVTFECDENFILIGDQRRECSSDGTWDLPGYGYTECLRQQEYSSRTAGYATSIVLGIVVTLVIILVYVGYKIIQRRRRDMAEEEPSDVLKGLSRSETRTSPPDDFYDDDSIPSSIKKSEPERSISPARETDIN